MTWKSDYVLARMPTPLFGLRQLTPDLVEFDQILDGLQRARMIVTEFQASGSEDFEQQSLRISATALSRWVDRLGELIKDGKLRKQMGSAAKAGVRKFDVEVIGKQLLDLIAAHLKHPRP